MGKARVELHNKLKEILGSENVYYQSPEGIKMRYPAIRYHKMDRMSEYADDNKYKKYDRYQIIVIDNRVDNPAINKILDLPYSSYERHYTSDNLNHDVIILYYKEDK